MTNIKIFCSVLTPSFHQLKSWVSSKAYRLDCSFIVTIHPFNISTNVFEKCPDLWLCYYKNLINCYHIKSMEFGVTLICIPDPLSLIFSSRINSLLSPLRWKLCFSINRSIILPAKNTMVLSFYLTCHFYALIATRISTVITFNSFNTKEAQWFPIICCGFKVSQIQTQYSLFYILLLLHISS